MSCARWKACNRNQVALAVGHEKRFEPPVQELMRMGEKRRAGDAAADRGNFVQDKFLSLPADNWRLSAGKRPPADTRPGSPARLSVGLLGPGRRAWFASVRQLGSQLTNGDTLGILVSINRAAITDQRDPRHPVRRPPRALRQQGWAEVRTRRIRRRR